jgi:hypothetical protein
MPETGLTIWVYDSAYVYRGSTLITWWTTEVQNFRNRGGFADIAFDAILSGGKKINIIKTKKDSGFYQYLKARYVHDDELGDVFDTDNYWKTMVVNGLDKGYKYPSETKREWDTYLEQTTVTDGITGILATDLQWQEMENAEAERWSDFL